MAMAEVQDVKLSQANTFTASARVMPTIVSLTKVSHVSKAEARKARKMLYLLYWESLQSHIAKGVEIQF